MYDLIMVRYGEMTLKKKNYRHFLKQINNNIKSKLKDFSNLRVENTNFRSYIYLNGEDHVPVIDKLNTVFGLSSYSLCVKTEPDYDHIADKAVELIKAEKKKAICTFKVETKRGDKTFPATSPIITKEIAARVLPRVSGLVVDVHKPDLTLHIDLRSEGTYIYVNSVKGLGGLPAAISGKGLLLISGGIDSPVAGFLALKKGIDLVALHFASPPFTSDMALQKVIDLLQEIAKFTATGKITLLVCPFTEIQDAIRKNVDNIYNITIMRRHMYRIADAVCRERDLGLIVSGESIGQVASQTVESLKVINEVTNLPVIRPLATYDKVEIIKTAREIGTYDISIRPYEDCCTIFVPEHPVIKPDARKVEFQESKFDFSELIKKALQNMESYELDSKTKFSIFEKMKIPGNYEI